MKTLILYYSYKGSSEKKAKELAKELGDCDLCKVEEVKKRSMFGAVMSGCPKAAKRKTSKIKPVSCDFKKFEKVILVAPIWNGFPAPAFNSMVELLPSGKDVELYLCSSGGETPKSKDGTIELIKNHGCHVVDYHDVKTAANIVG